MWTTKKPIDTQIIKKILVIQLRPFGDVFITSALFEPLRKAFPNAKLCLLLMEPYLSAVEGHPFIDEFITIPRLKGFKYFTNDNRAEIKKEINKLSGSTLFEEKEYVDYKKAN